MAGERARLKGRSKEVLAKLRPDLAEHREQYDEVHATWIEQLCNLEPIPAAGIIRHDQQAR